MGKGTVESVHELDNGWGLKLSVSRFDSAAGEPMLGRGVGPDIAVSGDSERHHVPVPSTMRPPARPEVCYTAPVPAGPDACRLSQVPPCHWSHHGYKHFPVEGMTRNDTRRGPAKYLAHFSARAIQVLERETTSAPDFAPSDAGDPKRMYLRNMREVIGWDMGLDAQFSFVECSGGQVDGRALHGRPMCDPTVKRVFGSMEGNTT